MNDEVKNTGSRDPDDEHCLVVGIGASAGGLEAFKRFLGAVPHRSGLAFVLIQHLDPTHQSMMADLLGKQTAMTVVEAHNAMVIEPDHVYVIPPGKFIKIADDGLFLASVNSVWPDQVNFACWTPKLAAGTYEVALQWKVTNGATAKLYSGAGTPGYDLHPRFSVREVS